MVKKKKKKGSSLLITVAMFAILSILIMSVLAMTTSGYSMRIKSNKRIENFYAADSGLEIAQKALHDYLGKSVEFGLVEAENYRLADGSIPSYEEKKEKFEEKFKEFVLLGGSVVINLIPETHSGVVNYVNDPIRYDSFKRDGKDINLISVLKSYKEDGSLINTPIATDKTLKKFILEAKSNFVDRDNKEREVSVDFEIIMPEYGQVLIRAKNSKAPSILDYIVGVDGDYIITTDTTTNIIGDMWVKGNSPMSNTITSENKYDGGILLRQPVGSTYSAPEVIWNGSIATNSTLHVDNILFKNRGMKDSDEENIFARNVKLDSSKIKDNSNKELFGGKSNLYVYNDFKMDGIGNQVVLNNFYGLNDINDYEANWTNKKLKNAQKSSAMMINSPDFGVNSKIKVLQDLFILGTSYLDLSGDDYQTGQSIIMNNISRPYTINDENYLYEYKNYKNGGIQIATKDKDGKEIPFSSGDGKGKVDLAKKYYEIEKDAFKAGIEVQEDKIASTGVILANNKAIYEPPTIEQAKKAKEKQGLFASEVFFMGDKKDCGQKEFWNNKVDMTAEGSFDWNEINVIASKDYTGDSKIVDEGGNNKDFIHLSTVLTTKDIYEEAKKDGHEFGKYDGAAGINGKAQLILSNSNKELVLRNTGNGIPKLIEENDNQIIYDVNIGNSNVAPPLLVISKGKITFEPFNGFNHIMLISANSAEIVIPYGASANIGNYQVGTIDGENKFINELFKYVLESDKILGGIGGGIFQGSEEKVAINAIEISKLIKTKNWKLIK